MNSLEKERKKIEKIDSKLKKLFIKRMNCSKEVKKIKDELGLDYFDSKREEFLKDKYSKDLTEFKEEYIEFLECLLKLSKDIMKK